MVVLGNEKVGKSSVLERLAMLPVFPKDTALCTRMAIELRLRRQAARMPIVQTIDISGPQERVIRQAYVPMDASGRFISEEMARVISDESALDSATEGEGAPGFSCNTMLRVLISSPHVGNIDLVDTPGLLGSSHQPASVQTVHHIVQHQIKRSPHALFLVVLPGNQSTNDSLALRLIAESKLQGKAMAVITRADLCDTDMFGNPTHYEHLVDMLGQLEKDHGLKYGGAVVSNRDVPLRTNHYERLHELARNEAEFFAADEPVFEELRTANQLSMTAVVGRISTMFHEYVRDTWIPLTLMALEDEKTALYDEDVGMGLPRAHEVGLSGPVLEGIKKPAGKALKTRLREGREELRQEWVAWLRELHEELVITSAPPEADAIANVFAFRPWVERQAERLREEVTNVVTLQVAMLPGRLSQKARAWLDSEDSTFRLGRFADLLDKVEARALRLLEDATPVVLRQLEDRIASHFADPALSWLSARFFPPYSSQQVEVAWDGHRLADLIIQDLVMSSMGGVVDSLHERLCALSDYPDVTWQEACAPRRTTVLESLGRLKDAGAHLLSTLFGPGGVQGNDVMELDWLPDDPSMPSVRVRGVASRLMDTLDECRCQRASTTQAILSLRRQLEEGPTIIADAEARRLQDERQHSELKHLYLQGAEYHKELEQIYRTLADLRRKVLDRESLDLDGLERNAFGYRPTDARVAG